MPDTFRENLEKTEALIEATSELIPVHDEYGDSLAPNKTWQALLDGLHNRSLTPMTTKLHPNQSSLLELSASSVGAKGARESNTNHQ